ncbi:ABC transporter ATP-binding protein [Cohnella phaseoli]|uniref:Uncharacterized protein n=1 Tax=Cohnella phaseoli TaxID=456490 RepID=A0A3D9HSE3_9BACL|nr:ABC transporter ATP-binding protein [Cohnella phaseoli]RED51776.1 hypothetical protein DFP98_1635 [Cohnella phaseoli]
MNKKRTRFFSENKSLVIEWLFILAILVSLFCIILYYTPLEVGRFIDSWNRQWEWATHWYGLLVIYWIEIILLVFIWDLFWFRLNRLVYTIYIELTHQWIKKMWLLLKLIRFKYGFNKLRYHMRVAFFFAGRGRDRKELIDYIGSPTPTDLLKTVLSLLFAKASIIAGILTLLTFDDLFFNTVQSKAIDLWNEGVAFVWDNFTKLSAFVVLVLLLFLGYFVSRRGIIRRAIAQANRKKLEDIVQMHRKLSHCIINIILKSSKNIEYAINCYDLIVESWAYKIQPGTTFSAERRWVYQRYRDSKDFQFEDIPELEPFLNEINNMKFAENANVSRWFLRSRYELLSLFLTNSTSLKIDRINRLLFTKKGFEEMYKIPDKYTRESDEVEVFDSGTIQAEVDDFKVFILEEYIIEGLELIYKLYRYSVVIENILHLESDKLGRGLRGFTNKE